MSNPDWEEHFDRDIISGTILFADISGFTPMTEKLAAAGKEAPEELMRLLNSYFNQLIQELEYESGEVVKFSGDALMVLFPDHGQPPGMAVRRAWQAAQAIQKLITESGPLKTSIGEITLQMKIGIGVGDVLALEAGGLLGRWEYVIAGEPVRQATVAESAATPGEVVLSAEAREIMHPEVLPQCNLETMVQPVLSQVEKIENTLRRFVPGAVLGWLETADRDWLGVLRPMTVLFLGQDEYDFYAEGALERFNELIRAVQKSLYRFEGSLNKVGVEDKGVVIMALFGAPPLAHEDDAERGLKAAMEIQELARKMDISLRIGVTSGPVFAGPIGSERRFEYTVMGDSVNTAARLMTAAPVGGILCDQMTQRNVAGKIRLDMLDPIAVKGKVDAVPVYRPDDSSLTERIISGSFRPPPMMVGRETDSVMIKHALSALSAGKGHFYLFEGGAGIGKSRLLNEVEMQARILGLTCLRGSGRSTEKLTGYLAWQEVFQEFFELSDDLDGAQRFSRVKERVAELSPAQLGQISVLQDWLNLDMEFGTQEIVLDPELREHNLRQFLLKLIVAWTRARPLVILLDDAQWIDTGSWQLIIDVAKAVADNDGALLLTLAARPMVRDSEQSRLRAAYLDTKDCEALTLRPLNRADMTLMIADRLSVLPDNIPKRLPQFIHKRSEGTPFVAEELLRAMQDQGMIKVWKDSDTNQHLCRLQGEAVDKTESLPGSVRGLILSRIDHMTADEQITLKVAAVLGRRFSFKALVELLAAAHDFKKPDVQQYLNDFADMDLVSVEQSEPQLIYRFSHQVTLEVAYDSLPFSQRRQLHETAAKWFEASYQGTDFKMTDLASLGHEPSSLTPYLGDLAAHYKAADNKQRELLYDLLAGRRAALLYQNEEADRYFTRALELVPADALADRFTVLRERELLYTLMSKRSARKTDLQAMQQVARKLGSNLLKGEVAVLQAIYQCGYGRAKAAATLARSALELGQASKQPEIEAKAHRWLGAALQMQGDHQQARIEMEQALGLAETIGNNSLEVDVATELARFAEKRGEFTACLEYCDRALALAREEGHLANEARILRRKASAHLGLGDLVQSRLDANEARDMQLQIGDRRQEAITLDLQGRIALASGDYAEAKANFERSLGVRHEIQDHAGQYKSLMLLGRACLLMGSFEKARLCYEQALEDAEEMELAYAQAEINARLVALEFSVGDNVKAKNHGMEAARRLSELNDPSLLATTLTSLGSALTELEEYDSAAAAFGNAVRIRQHLGQKTRLMEAVSGSAYLDFKCERPEAAMEKVEEILAHFGDQQINGIEQPARIYLICYEILDQAKDPRALELIGRGYAHLQETTNAISDPVLQESFMQCVAENRAVAYYYHELERAAGH